MKQTWVFLSFCFFTGLSSVHASTAKASAAARPGEGPLRAGDDPYWIFLNVSTSVQKIENFRTYVTEGSYEYYAIPPTNVTLAPGDVTMLHYRTNERFTCNHFHSEGDFPANHHDIAMIGFVLDGNGQVKQFMGQTEHGTEPTRTAPPAKPEPKFFSSGLVYYPPSGYELLKGARVMMVINNGPKPNNIDASLWASELPEGSACDTAVGLPQCYVDYHDFGSVAPFATLVAELKNDENTGVKYAHHGPVIFSSLESFDFYLVYKTAAGEVYGTISKTGFYGGTENELPVIEMPFPGKITILEPVDQSTIATLTPVIAWTPMNPADIPPGSKPLGYFLEVSIRPFDSFGSIHWTTIPHTEGTPQYRYQIPPNTLASGWTFYVAMTVLGGIPGIPDGPPENGTWPSIKHADPNGKQYVSFRIASDGGGPNNIVVPDVPAAPIERRRLPRP